MKFKLNGTSWEIKLALKRTDSMKNEIVVSDIKDIHAYLEQREKMDRQKIKEIIDACDKH